MTEQEVRTAYQALARHPEWPIVMGDLTAVAMSANDPSVRCGRADMLLHIQDMLLREMEGEANG